MNKAYLWQKLGSDIQRGLLDAEITEITEIMFNPDGSLWFTHHTQGNIPVCRDACPSATAFVHALAQYEHRFLNAKTPYLDAVPPFHGERINVTMPPMCDDVSFNIRKKATLIFTLDDYVQSKILTPQQVSLLQGAIENRKNIIKRAARLMLYQVQN